MISTAVGWMMKLVKPFEGLHKKVGGMIHPYICPAGYWTQGYGLLVKDGTVPPITPVEAEKRLAEAVPAYMLTTLKYCPRLWLEEPQVLAAISDFTFNLGGGRLKTSTLRRKINDGEWDEVPDELRKWVYGGGRRLPGLVRRAEARVAMIKAAKDDIE